MEMTPIKTLCGMATGIVKTNGTAGAGLRRAAARLAQEQRERERGLGPEAERVDQERTWTVMVEARA
jgi:hypothetical protein